jgi:hypothetical protein
LPARFDATLLLLMGCAVLLAMVAAGFWLLRRRLGSRASAARDLCASLDSYLDALVGQQAHQFDADRLWAQLERARTLHRQHFPELYAEMLELAKVHADVTTVLLQGHMRRHGAPTQWDDEEAKAQLEELQQRTAAAVLQSKRRCRTLAQLYADSQYPD